MSRYSYRRWAPYVPVAQRRRRAEQQVARMRKAGGDLSPVEIEGRRIATTFWGEAWCRNLESYSDYSNRLPRGRTYVRNGSVLDLEIAAGRVRALVCGSHLYTVEIRIQRLSPPDWSRVKARCAGGIGSLVELLRGTISKDVMEIVTRKGEGLFPSPREITLSCSCPDWATMCKHVAATLYGVGARLDRAPDLLFTLRGVDPDEMVESAVARPRPGRGSRSGRVLGSAELASVFGIELDNASIPKLRARKATPAKERTAKAAKPETRGAAKRRIAAEEAPAKKSKPVERTKVAKKKPANRAKPAGKKTTAKKAAGKNPAAKKARTAPARTKKRAS